jgi:hypothetical protein
MADPLQSGGLGPGEVAVLRELCKKIREEEKGKEGATSRGMPIATNRIQSSQSPFSGGS